MYLALTTILALLLVSVAIPAFAAGSANKELKFASREQLRACLDEEDAARARLNEFEGLLAENNASMLLIQTEAMALIDEQKRLDTTSEEQVNAFNKKSEDHNKYVKEANKRAEKLKADQDSFNAAMIEHNKKCATLVFKIADREAVLKERKAAGKRWSVD